MTGAGALVLVIEDELQIRRFLAATLTARGFRVLESSAGRDGMQLAASHLPDIIILDLGLPDMDGLEVVRQLREWSNVPILVLTARGAERDKVTVLEGGADDYITKPFGIHELTARIRVALRHAALAGGGEATPIVTIGDLSIDASRREVSLRGQKVHLTPLEYKVLAKLSRNAGRVCTHRQLLEEIWGPGSITQSHYLRIYMRQLRNKLEEHPERPRYLLTELGVGYRLADE